MPNSIQPRALDLHIRHLTVGDMEAAVGLARSFHAESAYAAMPLALAKVDTLIQRSMIDPDRTCIILANKQGDTAVGYLMAVIHEHYFSYTMTCSDLGFYISPGFRSPFAARAMLVQLEHWAFVVKGVADIALGVSSGIADAQVIRFYEKMGYRRGFAGLIKSR